MSGGGYLLVKVNLILRMCEIFTDEVPLAVPMLRRSQLQNVEGGGPSRNSERFCGCYEDRRVHLRHPHPPLTLVLDCPLL